VIACSLSSTGDLEVKEKEEKGNVDALGFPASNEIIPGMDSIGYRPRTVINGWHTFSGEIG